MKECRGKAGQGADGGSGLRSSASLSAALLQPAVGCSASPALPCCGPPCRDGAGSLPSVGHRGVDLWAVLEQWVGASKSCVLGARAASENGAGQHLGSWDETACSVSRNPTARDKPEAWGVAAQAAAHYGTPGQPSSPAHRLHSTRAPRKQLSAQHSALRQFWLSLSATGCLAELPAIAQIP